MKQNISRNGKYLQELLDETGLIPVSTNASIGHWTRENRHNPNEKSVIDYILVDKEIENQIEEIIIDEIGIYRLKGRTESDHNTILMDIKINHTKRNKKTITKWNTGTRQEWKNYNELIDTTYRG